MDPRRNILLFLTWILVPAIVVRAQDIDDVVKSQMQRLHIPGLSLAVVKDGIVIKAEGYGLADLERDIAVRPDTVFKTGSASNQFIATGIMLLVQDSKVRADDEVSRYIEGVPAAWQGITLRQLNDWPADSPVRTGVPMIRHGGSSPGFRASYARWPTHGLAVIVLTNLEDTPLDGLVASIAIRVVPELRTAPVSQSAPARQ